MKQLEKHVPDLILCELASMTAGDAGPFRGLVATLEILDPPVMLISADRFEEHTLVANLKLPVLDCISQSINPQILNWKVKNVLKLKAMFDQLRETHAVIHDKPQQPKAVSCLRAYDLFRTEYRMLFSPLVADLPEV
jgi:hypothetical protein